MTADNSVNGQRPRLRGWLAALLAIHAIACAVSLYSFATVWIFVPGGYHVFYHPDQLWTAVAAMAAFVPCAALFWLSDFSFGYVIGFYFYSMILGYLWLGAFTDLDYPHGAARFSAIASAVGFFLPVLFIRSPIRRPVVLSQAAFDKLLTLIVLLGIATVLIGASYNFRFVSIENIYKFRETMESPIILRYLIGITSTTLLPFAFACFATRKAYFRATFVLLLLVFFYPITFSKIALFTPVWLLTIYLLSRFVEARTAIVLSLTAPIILGIVLVALLGIDARLYFALVNVRMVAIPSIAMDVYNDFFSKHELTYFCQISFLKQITQCPYQEPLSAVMARAYQLGFFNASLFATEGVASVGVTLAPLAALACGLLLSLGNRLSAGLAPEFILISSAIVPQVLLNVPLTTALLTHGLLFLFLLWFVTPRAIATPETATPPSIGP
jgi:hypothetical protein